MYPFFALTTFLGSFLVFFSELLYAKRLLPWFGGSATVWLVALLFFTTLLFLGYLYAHLLSTRATRMQYRIHTAVAVAVACVTFAQVYFWGGLMPPYELCCASLAHPSHAVLVALAGTLGIQFLLLASGSVLLIAWYARFSAGTARHHDPHTLYRYSNAGSLSALLLFPTLIEPLSGAVIQERAWLMLFATYSFFVVACSILTRTRLATPALTPSHVPETLTAPETKRQTLAWIAYAMLGTMLLLVGTRILTESVTPAPFLWSIPLILYLLSFIIAFSEHRSLLRHSALVTLFSTFLVAFLSAAPLHSLSLSILFVSIYLGAATTMVHARLYALRPTDTGDLSRFYLAIAGGGALGTCVIAYLAPLFSHAYIEIPIILTLVTVVAYRILTHHVRSGTLFHRGHYRAMTAILLVWTAGVPLALHITTKETVDSSRTFYGVSTIATRTIEGDTYTAIINGTILHGLQHTDELLRLSPTSYYARGSGVEHAFTLARAEQHSLAVATIGLGAGVVAAYCAPQDHHTFFELNPAVAEQARTHFTFLNHCNTDVVIGDGRLALEDSITNEGAQYDLIILDAFTDDAIPATLLTREAFEIYNRALTHHGILAIHISNSYLRLLPVVHAGIAHIGMSGIRINGTPKTRGALSSDWVIASRDTTTLEALVVMPEMEATLLVGTPSTRPWTDDRSSILPLLKW